MTRIMEANQCEAYVYHRDTYRVSRRGDGRHFRMHYSKEQCQRNAATEGLCAQHAKKLKDWGWVDRLDGWQLSAQKRRTETAQKQPTAIEASVNETATDGVQ